MTRIHFTELEEKARKAFPGLELETTTGQLIELKNILDLDDDQRMAVIRAIAEEKSSTEVLELLAPGIAELRLSNSQAATLIQEWAQVTQLGKLLGGVDSQQPSGSES